jgi:CRP/FNR family nitrogen fixation transcriptional regulator
MSNGGSFDQSCAPTLFARHDEIYREGKPAEFIYKIESGCVRTHNTLNGGRRQIDAFYFPGEFFGLDAHAVHGSSAVAVIPSAIRIMSRAAGDVVTTQHLLTLTAGEMQRIKKHNQLLRKRAEERVVGFLLDLAQRGRNQSEVDLPMARRDIADYLDLTIETVSRTLSRLERASAISLATPWRVILRDPSAIDWFNSQT